MNNIALIHCIPSQGATMEMIRLYSWEDYESLPETSWKIKQPRDDEVRENALETGDYPHMFHCNSQ